jgi:hypothetical protein
VALRRPQAPGAGEGFAGLAALWVEGLSRAHDPGCGCGGLFMPVLQADMIEDDLTDYLLARYRKEGFADLVALVEARKSDAQGLAARRFEDWIGGLAGAGLSEAGLARIGADLRTFLESLAGQGRSSIGICT